MPAGSLKAPLRPALPNSASFDVVALRYAVLAASTLSFARAAHASGIKRHRFRIGDSQAFFRMQATNVLNSYGWEVAGNNAFIYAQPRRLLIRLAIDF